MTRETKIGLLVGLAFIVVFAMLLQHSGPTAPPGDIRQLARAQKPAVLPLANEPVPEPDVSPVASFQDTPDPDTPPMSEGSPASTTLDPPEPTDHDSPDMLPRPAILNPSDPLVPDPSPSGIADADGRGSKLEIMRKAPDEIVPPTPSVRETMPTSSREPIALAESDSIRREPEPTKAPAESVVTSDPPARSKEHVVQKGETVHSILRAEYNSTSPKVVEAFRAANKGQIKDIDVVIEGQKVILPALPRDLFEPVGPSKVIVDATQKTRDSDLAQIGAVLNKGRKAPAPGAKLTDSAKDREKRTDREVEKPVASTRRAPKENRFHEVQVKETFSSIARDQLGSEALWKEIQRLNPNVDPGKVKPGTKLRLPTRRPLADSAAGRT